MSAEAEREAQQWWARVRNDPYTSAVIDTLSADFPDLRDPVVADVVRSNVYVNSRTPCGLEVIVDDPITANWRLIPARDRRRVYLACWQLKPTVAERARMDRLNAALDAIPVPTAGELDQRVAELRETGRSVRTTGRPIMTMIAEALGTDDERKG